MNSPVAHVVHLATHSRTADVRRAEYYQRLLEGLMVDGLVHGGSVGSGGGEEPIRERQLGNGAQGEQVLAS